jgi:hypothetical protein
MMATRVLRRRRITSMGLPVMLLLVAGSVSAAELPCEQSESTVVVAPKGRWASSVQHQVCDTGRGMAAAAVTVFVGDPAAPMQGTRVVAIAVPRTRDEWPKAVWRSEAELEVWVPNLAQVLETRPAPAGVTVTLKYCGDDPAARAAVAQYDKDLQSWKEATTRWVEARKKDAATVGERPVRPEEPRVARRACTDADLAAH